MEFYWLSLVANQKAEKASHLEWNSLSFVCSRLTVSFNFPTFTCSPGIWPFWGLVICYHRKTIWPQFFMRLSFGSNIVKGYMEPLAWGSVFHSHFDSVMTQFIISKRTDEWKNWRQICAQFCRQSLSSMLTLFKT